MSEMSRATARTPEEQESRRLKVRVREATVREEVRLATDALAAADLLLGLNFSISALGREPRK